MLAHASLVYIVSRVFIYKITITNTKITVKLNKYLQRTQREK